MEIEPRQPSEILTCATAPGMKFSSREELHQHYKSEWHRYNLRRRAAGLACITKEVFDKVVAAVQLKELEAQRKKEEKKRDHVAAKHRHEDEEEELEAEDRDDDDFGDDGALAARKEDSSRGKRLPERAKEATEKEDEGAESDVDDEELERRVKKAIEAFTKNPLTCVFERGVTFGDIGENLKHMYERHGFFIPDLEFVTDVAGVVNYCAEKVHVGRLCLYCGRPFRTAAACVAHMDAKGHARIPWEFEDQVEEYSDFYDFPEMDPNANGTMRVDEMTGELVLTDPDGTVKRIAPKDGYRDLQRSAAALRSAESSTDFDRAVGLSNGTKERALQVYRVSGVLTTATGASVFRTRRALMKHKNEIESRRRREMKRELEDGISQNWAVKNRKAKTNVGAGQVSGKRVFPERDVLTSIPGRVFTDEEGEGDGSSEIGIHNDVYTRELID